MALTIGVDASRATRAQRTGTENYARQVIERLVLGHPDVMWRLYFRDDPGQWLAHLPQVERIIIPAPRLWTYAALAPALLKNRPDAFWEPSHVLPPTVPLCGIPSLVTVHDIGYEYFPAAHTPAQLAYLRLTTRYHALAATRLITVSHATRRDLVRVYKTPVARIGVAPLGVDHADFHPISSGAARAATRYRYGIGARYLLYIGTLQPRKNVARLLRAFAPVAARYPDVQLVLVGGKGWGSDDLQRQVDGSGLAGRVLLTGYIGEAELPALLSGAEAFTLPSLFEGFGLPVLEAMACGTPVLTSNSSSLPEVAGDAALLVNPLSEQQITDGLLLLLGQPALRAAMRERGLQQAARFTWEQTAQGVWDALQSILPSRATISVLGLPIHNLTWEQTLDRIEQMIASRRPHMLVTANPEILMRARREPDFMAILRRADVVMADGVGLLLAARWQGVRFAERITGSDLTPKLARRAAQKGWKLYLLGAGPGVARRAAQVLRQRHPDLDIIADGADPTPDGPPDVLERIRAAAPDILLVAYGAPRQERWIEQSGKQTGVPVQIGIGGSLDFVAGVVPRAPMRWQKLNLEWLWRLKQEPWRWRRMLALPRFALLAACEAFQKRMIARDR